jgi:hypothetical protein
VTLRGAAARADHTRFTASGALSPLQVSAPDWEDGESVAEKETARPIRKSRSYSIVALATGSNPASTGGMPSATPADRALIAAVPLTRDYYCSELVASAYMRMGLLPSAMKSDVRRQLSLSSSVTLANTYWPNAWCAGGVVDALLPEGYRLDREVLLDCTAPPVAHALDRTF